MSGELVTQEVTSGRNRTTSLPCGRDVFLWWGGAFSKEILLHLLHDRFLIFAAGRVQAIFVEQHFAELDPAIPRLLGNVVINFLAKIGVEGRFIEAGELLFQLHAENCVCHGLSCKNYLTGWMKRRVEVNCRDVATLRLYRLKSTGLGGGWG